MTQVRTDSTLGIRIQMMLYGVPKSRASPLTIASRFSEVAKVPADPGVPAHVNAEATLINGLRGQRALG